MLRYIQMFFDKPKKDQRKIGFLCIPLLNAVYKGDVAAFRKLIEQDPRLVYAVDDSNTPILCEVFAVRNLEMAKVLFERREYHGRVYRADPNVEVTLYNPPRSLIAEAVAATHEGFVELLINNGAFVDEEIGGFSVRKILENPKQYVKKLFDGHDQCFGAKRFLENAQRIKVLVNGLRPPPIEISTTTESAIAEMGVTRGEAPTPPPSISMR